MEDYVERFGEHAMMFATLTTLIDNMRGNKITLNGDYIKKAWFDKKEDYYKAEIKSGEILNAYDMETYKLRNDINIWRKKNTIKFNTIMGI